MMRVNTERIASLFLAKTIYASLIAVVVAATAVAYPFLPRQFTVVSSLSIGIPAFVLALAVGCGSDTEDPAQPDQDEGVDRHFGNGKKNLHDRSAAPAHLARWGRRRQTSIGRFSGTSAVSFACARRLRRRARCG